MQTKTKLVICAASIVISYAFGYYEAPYKIKTEIKTVEVEKKVETSESDTERNKHRKITTIETTAPDGTKTKTTTSTEDTSTSKKTDSSTSDDTSKSTTEKKEIIKTGKTLNIAVLASEHITAPGVPVYGASVTTTLVGPVTVGVFGFTNGAIGASVGLNF